MPTITKPTGRESDKFMLRLPDGMRDEIARSAHEKNRTMNAEIVTRLSESLQGAGSLPLAIRDDVERIAREQGCTTQEALVQLVTLGLSKGGTLFFVKVGPGTTMAELRAMLDRAYEVIPESASVVLEQGA